MNVAGGTALAAEGVEKVFGGLRALRGVSIEVREGEIVGLIGPNGSGKTTLLNVLSGLLRPTAGRVRLGAEDVTGLPPDAVAKRGIGRTFQGIRLFPRLTVLENVLVAASVPRPRGGAAWEVRAVRALEELGVGHLACRFAATLAYGEQRRVEVARALALEPRFLLVDEPFAGMNPAESDELVGRLRAIRERRGCGLLVVDHDLRVIHELCERVVVLNEGEKIGEGPPSRVYLDPVVVRAYVGEKAASRFAVRAVEAHDGFGGERG
ncbi:MAG TPA: ABC transporter ATP-binding protein [Actinomycetota bacterium]|nr:ABC transporter ATP-binding protein [Actinomycetota bacterium]